MSRTNTSRAAQLLAEIDSRLSVRVEELKSLTLLRIDENGPEKEEMVSKLSEASRAVSDIEKKLRALDAFCVKEVAMLNSSKVVLAEAQKQSAKLDLMEANLPKHLPKPTRNFTAADPAQPTSALSDVSNVQSFGDPPKSQSKKKHKAKSNKTQVIPAIEYVTLSELKSAPQYIVGRLTLEKVNSGVSALNQALEAKYELLQRPMRELSSQELDLVQSYHDESFSDEAGSSSFFSSNDVRNCDGLRPASTAKGILNILRHLKRIREVHGPKNSRLYIILT